MKISRTILGLDLGPTSIGWAFIDEVNEAILGAGVRVFPEGVDRDKTGGEVPKNQQRRTARGMRRQIRRRAERKTILRHALVHLGLLPGAAVLSIDHPERQEWDRQQSQHEANPYDLRRAALERPLTPHELGRVLLHFGQRRGFLSNRKTDRAKAKETSEMLDEIANLQAEIQQAGHRTLGEHLSRLGASGSRIRGRHTRRQMFIDEFEAIWNFQQNHHPEILTTANKCGEDGPSDKPRTPRRLGLTKSPMPIDRRQIALARLRRFGLHGLIFFQRPVYWPKSVIGRCELDPDEERCPRADRAAQEFRILLEVNNLRMIDSSGEIKELTPEQRRIVLELLMTNKEVKFDAIRKKLGLREEKDSFNLERGERKKLDGHATDAILAHKDRLGKKWKERPDAERTAIVRAALEAERFNNDAGFLERCRDEWRISEVEANAILDAPLPEGHSNYGRKTIERLLPFLRQGLPLSGGKEVRCAIREAGFLQPWERPRQSGDILPRPPKVTNPIVRQALFQVRRLVNAVIREFGKPDAIRVELGRETKGNAVQRKSRIKQMNERRDRRDAAARAIEEYGHKPTRGAIEAYLLWQEQGGVCLYSGNPISLPQLFSGEVNVDHILPYAYSLDDSMANKVVCFRNENDDKGNNTPHQWLAGSEPERYAAILDRVDKLPREVRLQKFPRFVREDCRIDDFIQRQLVDTQYISSVVAGYLQCVCEDVVASKGVYTADLRHLWGMNSILNPGKEPEKSRADHRHHAVDAIAVALTSRARLQILAKRRGEMPPPWTGFLDDARKIVHGIVVSHRVRRGIREALHEETAYGATSKPQDGADRDRGHAKDWIEEEGVYVVRKPIEQLTLNEVDKIRDLRVRELVIERLKAKGLIAGRKKKGEEASTGGIPKDVWKEPIRVKPRKGNGLGEILKKVRVTKPEKSIVVLGSGSSRRYVKPGNLHHVAIFETTDAKGGSRRFAEFVSMLEAARRSRNKEPLVRKISSQDPTARFIMSLSRGEAVVGNFKGERRIVVFSTGASTQGQLYFVDHTDARPSADVKKFAVKASTLNGNKVAVDFLGRLHPAND